MSTDISIEPNAPYPPHSEIDLEPDFAGAPSSSHYEEGGSLTNRKPPQKFRGRDRQPDSTFLRHVTHCSICNHPEREAIEQAILHWYSPTVIVHEFDLADRRIVYRHAHALGLFHIRAEQSRHALGFLIEQAQSIVPSADAIIRAVRALSCIDDHGHWHEPRKEVVITHRYEEVVSQPTDREIGAPDTREQQPRQLVAAGSSRPRSGAGTTCRRGPARPRRDTSAASQPAETRHKSWSPLRLFSTRLLRKDPPNSSPLNKTAKTSRHTFAEFNDVDKRAVAPASRRRF